MILRPVITITLCWQSLPRLSRGAIATISLLASVSPLISAADTSNAFHNLSSRGYVGTGADVLIAGLIVDQPTNVLIRGVGPGLLPFHVPLPLPQTQLKLYNDKGKVLYENADWRQAIPGSPGTTTEVIVADIMRSVGAFALRQGDSALYLRLQPGLYTVELSGKSGMTGVGLVEAFRIPADLDPLDPLWRLPLSASGSESHLGKAPGMLVGDKAGAALRLMFDTPLPLPVEGSRPVVDIPWMPHGDSRKKKVGRPGVVDSRGWTSSPLFEKTGEHTASVRNLVMKPGEEGASVETIQLTFSSLTGGVFAYTRQRLEPEHRGGAVLETASGNFSLIRSSDVNIPAAAHAATFFPRHADAYSDGRSSIFWGLQASDAGQVFTRGLGPNQCDQEGVREPVITRIGDQYLLHYDGAGVRGWLACSATSTDLVNWVRQGPILDFGPAGSRDAGAACSPWIIEDRGTWHMFYLGSRTQTPPPERVPESPYPTLKAKAVSAFGPWTKQPEVNVIALNSAFPSPDSSPGAIVRGPTGWRQYFSIADYNPPPAAPQRTLMLGQTQNLDATWSFGSDPLLPWNEQVENSSIFYDDTSGHWFLFTNHVGLDVTGAEYTDAVWVYWSRDPERFDPRNKAVVMDASTSTWAHGAIGMPTVVKAKGKLALLYDGVPGAGTTHLPRDIGLAWIPLPLTPPDLAH